jgi:hypothetical protein
MSELDPRALEAAARAVCEIDCDDPWDEAIDSERAHLRWIARAAVTAYLAAMPPPVSPELIAKLNALASRLTQMGEYEAVDLIDTVVARVTPLPAPPAAQDTRP